MRKFVLTTLYIAAIAFLASLFFANHWADWFWHCASGGLTLLFGGGVSPPYVAPVLFLGAAYWLSRLRREAAYHLGVLGWSLGGSILTIVLALRHHLGG